MVPLPTTNEKKQSLCVADLDDPDSHFVPLFQRISLDNFIIESIHDFNDNIPYDYFCPTIRTHLKERICSTCNKYFASKKSVQNHMRAFKHKVSSHSSMKIKPYIYAYYNYYV